MYKDDINVFSKNEKIQEALIQTIRIYCLDIGMEFDTEKSVLLSMKSGKIEITEGIELLNQESISTLGEKGNYLY